ncbi:DUF192 domain-containing protein [candidate division WOR-3 bacterium]|nr:DUF192 domain-containing protein [candidate division WOR-3 bacterium]
MLILCIGCSENDRTLSSESDYSPEYYGYSPDFDDAVAVINGETLFIEIADDDNERSLGLMFRDSLEGDAGMLFVFEEPQKLNFWMKNTSLELDIAFADSQFIIREIKPLEPYSVENIFSGFDAQYALEVNRGWFSSKNVSLGDKIQIIK